MADAVRCRFDEARFIRHKRYLAANGIDPTGEFLRRRYLVRRLIQAGRHASRLQGGHPSLSATDHRSLNNLSFPSQITTNSLPIDLYSISLSTISSPLPVVVIYFGLVAIYLNPCCTLVCYSYLPFLPAAAPVLITNKILRKIQL